MLICNENRFVFMAVPKTATRSIYRVLKGYFLCTQGQDHTIKTSKHARDYFRFCVKRNPYDRVCSAYWHICKRDLLTVGGVCYSKHIKDNTLHGFLNTIKTMAGQHAMTKPQAIYYETNLYDQVLRFEHLQEDFDTLPFLEYPLRLPIVNAFEHPHWTDLVDKVTGPMINDIYAKDFEILGYEKIEF